MNWLEHIQPSKIKSLRHWNRYVRYIDSRSVVAAGRTEGHHKWPKSVGGANDAYNIISLSPREHFLAHLILHKAIGGPMSKAYWLMCNIKGERINSRAYDSAREESVKMLSLRMNADNPFRGKAHNPNTISKISEASKKQREPESKKRIFRQVWSKKPEVWKYAQTAHEAWLRYNKPGATRLSQLLDVGLTGMQLEYMVDRFRAAGSWKGFDPWIPSNDEYWVDQFPEAPVVIVDEEKHSELIDILLTGKKHSLETRRKIASSKP